MIKQQHIKKKRLSSFFLFAVKKMSKSFGDFVEIVYNKTMKRFGHIMLSIMLILPIFVGICFLSPNYAPETLNGGGGGANSLNSPKTDNNSDLNKVENGDDYVVTHKTYDEYFIDYDISKDTITGQDLTGSGSATDPYLVHSTRGFLYLTNYALSGISITARYIELACDVVLNEEKFDENGNPSGGDGFVYTWKSISGFENGFFDGNNHTIYGLYHDNMTSTNVAVFACNLKEIENLTVENVFLRAQAYVAPVAVKGSSLVVKNVHSKNGTIKGNHSLSGLCHNLKQIEDSSNGLNIFQIEGTTHYAWGHIAGVVREDGSANVINCKNYGNIEFFDAGAVAGIVTYANESVVSHCSNYGQIKRTDSTSYYGMGGIVGQIVENSLITYCDNHGTIDNGGSGIVGSITGNLKIISKVLYCRNFADNISAVGIIGGSNACEVIGCENYGNITGASPLVGNIGDMNLKHTTKIIDCHNYGNVEVTDIRQQLGLIASVPRGKVLIENCSYDCVVTGYASYYFGGVFGYAPTSSNLDIMIKNVSQKIKCDIETSQDPICVLSQSVYNGNNVVVKNCSVFVEAKCRVLFIRSGLNIGNITFENIKADIKAKGFDITENKINENISLKNLIVYRRFDNEANAKDYKWENIKETKYKSIVFEDIFLNSQKTYFCGTDFSDFYVDFKTGKIGLKALSGKGVFQGKVTEELLVSKGFEKKVI